MQWTKRDPFRPTLRVWFAWYPVTCADGQVRWLERVRRVTWWLGSYAGMHKIHEDYPMHWEAEANKHFARELKERER